MKNNNVDIKNLFKTAKPLILLMLAVFIFEFQICLAQENLETEISQHIGLSIDQSIFSFNLNPGDEKEFVLNIKNIGAEKQVASCDFCDLSLDNDNDVKIMPEKNEIFGMKDWLSIEEAKWTMAGGDEKRLKFIINVPDNASVGSHYSAVVIRALPEIDFENFQKPIIGGEIGIYVLVNVNGEINGKGNLRDFKAPTIVSKEADLEVTFENQGNVHYVPYGEIKMKNLLSGKEHEQKLEKHFVFPGKSYSYSSKWEVPSALGIYKAKAFFVDQENRQLEKTRIIITKTSFVLFLALLLIILAFFYFMKRKKGKTVEKGLLKSSEEGEEKSTEDVLKCLILLFIFSSLIFYGSKCLAGKYLIEASQHLNGLKVSWDRSTLSDMDGVIIVKKEKTCPRILAEGEEIYRGNADNVIDEDVKRDHVYCYGAAVFDQIGNVSPLKWTGEIQYIGFWKYLAKIFTSNYILIVGPIVIIFLVWVDYFTRKRYEREIVEKMNLEG